MHLTLCIVSSVPSILLVESFLPIRDALTFLRRHVTHDRTCSGGKEDFRCGSATGEIEFWSGMDVIVGAAVVALESCGCDALSL